MDVDLGGHPVWLSWDNMQTTHLKDGDTISKIPFLIKFHHRISVLGIIFLLYQQEGKEVPEFLKVMAGSIPTSYRGPMSRGRAQALGLQQTLSMDSAVAESWFNRFKELMSQPSTFEDEFRKEVSSLCHGDIDKVCDFKGMSTMVRRLDPGWGLV